MADHHIALLPGDGIGPEVVGAARRALVALGATMPGLGFRFTEALIGMSAFMETGDPLPPETVQVIRGADAVLHGATGGASLPKGLPNPLHGLRTALGTFATIRPAHTYPGVASLHQDVDVVVVREISEGLHARVEHAAGKNAVCSVRVTTREATERVATTALELAERRRGVLTVVHKLGAIPLGDGLWIETIEEVAPRFPAVKLDLRNVDACAHELIQRPGEFDVILAENSRGDILSDIAAALVGGLGLAASGCVGETRAYFEPIHGTAPDIAGRGVANPAATILAAELMLDHLGESHAAGRLRDAVARTLAAGKVLTPDIGGTSGTEAFTDAVIAQIMADPTDA